MSDSGNSIAIQSRKEVYKDRWVSLKVANYVDRTGGSGTWSYLERSAGQEAVVVVPLIGTPAGKIVVIRQFRIPLGAWVWEFPAGLVDPGETLEIAALRELREETGYTGVVEEIGPAVASSPGIITETVHFARVRIDGDQGHHEREPSELIEVHVVDLSERREFLERLTLGHERIDAKLYLYLANFT